MLGRIPLNVNAKPFCKLTGRFCDIEAVTKVVYWLAKTLYIVVVQHCMHNMLIGAALSIEHCALIIVFTVPA